MAIDCSGEIVVGHDDSAASTEAVRWAASLAAALGRPLRIVHAWTWPLFSYGFGQVDMFDAGAAPRNHALHLLDQAVEIAQRAVDGTEGRAGTDGRGDTDGGAGADGRGGTGAGAGTGDGAGGGGSSIEIFSDLLPGAAREVLGEVSESAELLVVGTRGLGGVLGMLLGSVSRGLLHDAGCPVAIIRSDQYVGGPVLAACDGSEAGREAIDLAADLADLWDDELRILHVVPAGDPPTEEEMARARSLLREAGERARAGHDTLTVTEELMTAPSVPGALLDAATGARLLVLGHRGISHDRFGSTAHAAVVHATGNVVIVRPRHGSAATRA